MAHFSICVLRLLFGSYLGAYTAANLSGSILQKCLGVFALTISAKMWFGLKAREGAKIPNNGILAIAGLIIGSISSLFGIGGGSISVPFFRRISLTIQQAVATSAALDCRLRSSSHFKYLFRLRSCELTDNVYRLCLLARFFWYCDHKCILCSSRC